MQKIQATKPQLVNSNENEEEEKVKEKVQDVSCLPDINDWKQPHEIWMSSTYYYKRQKYPFEEANNPIKEVTTAGQFADIKEEWKTLLATFDV